MRSTGAPAWLSLSLALGVGFATVSCGGKGDGGETGDTASDTVTMSASNTDSGHEATFNPNNSDGATYAGPDENWTVGDSESSTGPNATTSTTSTPDDTATTWGDGSTYAGPDEDWTISEPETSESRGDSSSSSGGGETEGETEGETDPGSSSGDTGP